MVYNAYTDPDDEDGRSMKQAQDYTSFAEVISDLAGLVEAIEDIRQRLAKDGVPYPSQDARHVALDGMQCDIGACGNWINCLASLQQLCQFSFGDEWERNYQERIGTALGIDQSEGLMLDYLRNTLTTKVHFKIETLLSNVLRAVGGTSPRGFSRIADDALKLAGVAKHASGKDVLTVMANIRNSYHANGIHGNADLKVELDGCVFAFVNGQRVECAGWRHVLTAIRGSVAVLDAFLFSPPVSAHETEILDEFSAVKT